MTALRSFFSITLDRYDLRKPLFRVEQPRKLPTVQTQEEVARLLDAAPGAKYKAALSVAYGAGLRASEVLALKVSDIDSARMLLRVEQGKGRKESSAPRWRRWRWRRYVNRVRCYLRWPGTGMKTLGGLAIRTRVRCSRTSDTVASSFRVTFVLRVTLVLHGALVLRGTLVRRCGLARPPASVFIVYLRLPERLHVFPAKLVAALFFGRILFDAFDEPFPEPALDPGEVLLIEFR
jgi:hypothetical protein